MTLLLLFLLLSLWGCGNKTPASPTSSASSNPSSLSPERAPRLTDLERLGLEQSLSEIKRRMSLGSVKAATEAKLSSVSASVGPSQLKAEIGGKIKAVAEARLVQLGLVADVGERMDQVLLEYRRSLALVDLTDPEAINRSMHSQNVGYAVLTGEIDKVESQLESHDVNLLRLKVILAQIEMETALNEKLANSAPPPPSVKEVSTSLANIKSAQTVVHSIVAILTDRFLGTLPLMSVEQSLVAVDEMEIRLDQVRSFMETPVDPADVEAQSRVEAQIVSELAKHIVSILLRSKSGVGKFDGSDKRMVQECVNKITAAESEGRKWPALLNEVQVQAKTGGGDTLSVKFGDLANKLLRTVFLES